MVCVEPGRVPLVDVVTYDEVFVNRTGARTGLLERPSRQEKIDTFGTENNDEIMAFMINNGQEQGLHRKGPVVF